MDIKELRIGNIVKIDDEYLGPIEGKVTSLNEKAEVELLLSVNKGNIRNFRCGSDDIFPIPITEELLLKNGFKKPKEDVFVVKDFCTLLRVTFYPKETAFELDKHSFFPSDIIETIQSSVIVLNNPIYVHTLQNIWYLLTGKELEIKL